MAQGLNQQQDKLGKPGKAGTSALVAVVVVVVLAGVVFVALLRHRKPAPTEVRGPKTAPATVPATAPAPAAKPAKPPEPEYARGLMDVVRATYPAFPATQPLAVPVDLSEAARLVLKDPVYFDAAGSYLWITRADARPTDDLLKVRPDDPERVLVTREHVLYAHWMADENGQWRPFLVTPATGGAGYELVCHLGRRKIGGRTGYRWDRASSWNDKIVVPTATGVSLFRFATDGDGRLVEAAPGPEPIEEYQDLVDPAVTTRPATGPAGAPTTRDTNVASARANYAEPQTLLDVKGLLAWIPWDPGKQGGRGAARYVDGKWTILDPAGGWPEKVLHLVRLLDGSVIQFVLTPPDEGEAGAGGRAGGEEKTGADAGGKAGEKAAGDPHTWPIRLGVTKLENVAVDRQKIRQLVDKLGDDDPAVRDAAYKELTQYGPEIWPVLKDLVDDAPPEAQARMRQLLRSQTTPLLGGMVLLGDKLQLVCRDRDGTAVFFSERGVQTGDQDGQPVVQAPAWLAVRPESGVQLLDPRMVADLRPDRARISSVADGWVVTGDARGPQWFVGNGFVPLLRKSEAAFADLVGEDHRGRWVFRPPPPGALRRIIDSSAGESRTGDAGDTGDTKAGQSPAGPASAPATGPAGADHGAAAGADVRGPDVRAVEGQTLIIDPTLPNLIPRLPVWSYTTADEAGWDKENWPAIRQLNHVARLKDSGWEVLGEDAALFNKPEQVPPVPGPPPVTQPASELRAALVQAAQALKGAEAGQNPQTAPAEATTQVSAAEATRPPSATTAPAHPATSAPAEVSTTRPSTVPATAPTTVPTTAPTTIPTTGPAGAAEPAATSDSAPAPSASDTLLWVDRDGTRYYDGTESLRVVSPGGSQTTWTLPASAAGKAPAHLVKTDDGRLFLFNEPGRVLRIKPTPGAAEPFLVEATFTRNVPNADAPTRVWLDPAGRIIIAYENKLAILFPTGYIPAAIRDLMKNPEEADEGEGR